MKIHRMLSFARRKEGSDAPLEELRLQEEALAGALGIAWHSHVKRIDERFNAVGYILNLYVGEFGRAHSSFDHFPERLLAFCRRIVVVVLLPLGAGLTRILDANVTFDRPILSEDQVGRALLERFLGSCNW